MSDESSTDTYTVSFKTSPGYDASLIVVRGNTAEELTANLLALSEQEGGPDSSVMELVVDTENLVHAAYAAKAPEKPSKTPSGAAESAPAADTGPVRMCSHGKRTRREGNGAKGPWVGWFCPTPKGTADQCKPEWEDK